VLLDDYFLCDYVNHYLLKISEQAINDGDVDKVELINSVKPVSYELFNGLFYKRKDNSRYKTSLQAGLWSRDYFANSLIPGKTAWQFESVQDGYSCNILKTKENAVLYGNVLVRGKINPKALDKFNEDDRKHLKDELFSLGYG